MCTLCENCSIIIKKQPSHLRGCKLRNGTSPDIVHTVPRRTAMNNKNIEEIDFLSLTTEEAEKFGLNAIFKEEDGTYDWIYCMNMMKDRSMFTFYFKIVGLCFLPIVIMMIWMAASSRLSMSTFLITMLSFGGVLLVVIFAIWLVNTMYGGKYMMIYQMNEEGITFSQTTDQAAMTRAIAAASAAVSAAGGNTGGVISGTGMTLRANAYHSKFSKVRSVKCVRKDNLIWVNTFLQYQQVYVPKSAFNFVWNYISERCVNAKIIYG